MDIKKIAQFVSPRLNSRPANQPSEQAPTSVQNRSSGSQNSEAVKISTSLSSSSESEARVARIKSQVESGSYSPNSSDVAQALVRDLIA